MSHVIDLNEDNFYLKFVKANLKRIIVHAKSQKKDSWRLAMPRKTDVCLMTSTETRFVE